MKFFLIFTIIILAYAKNYYQVLGIKKNSNQQDIKSAYRKLALKHHPDKNRNKDKNICEKKLIELNEAYQTLKNKQKRKDYDRKKNNSGIKQFNSHYFPGLTKNNKKTWFIFFYTSQSNRFHNINTYISKINKQLKLNINYGLVECGKNIQFCKQFDSKKNFIIKVLPSITGRINIQKYQGKFCIHKFLNFFLNT